MKHLVAIRHVAFEDLGSFESVFKKLGYGINYLDAGKDELHLIHPLDPDLLVICGGPISANDEHLHPFLKEEFKIVQERIRRHRPILGLCLGSQVIAKALGSTVYSIRAKEIGWYPLTLTEAGKQSPLHYLDADQTHVFHWHGETFDLPKEATLLASTPVCKSQAFAYGKRVLGIQFHPEVIPHHLEQWYIGHTCELSQHPEIELHKLRRDAKHWGNTLQLQAERFLTEWVKSF